MKHIRLYIALIILVCMALCCSITVKAFAVSEGQEAPPAPEEQETTPLPEEPPADPTVYAYTVTITPPDGWYLNTATIQVGITGDAWAKVELQRPGASAWEDVTDQLQSGSAKVNISANGIYRVRITDPSGETHETEQNIECIDNAPPTVWAGIRDKLLHTEASDTQSGIAGIMVDGCLYTTLTNGGLDLRIQDYINAGPTISIIALDNVGNLSDETLLDNPYYSDEPETTQPPVPTPTPIVIYTGDPNAPQPTQPPQQYQGGQQGMQGGSQTYPSGGQQTMQTPVQAATPTPEPYPTITPIPMPTAEPTPTPEPLEPYEGTGFTNSGQFITRDMLYDKFTNKLFVTVETRDGSLFYLVVDYDKPLDEEGEAYETYFLNAVDGADLTAFLPESSTEPEATPEPEVCTCADKCTVGHIDTACPVCRVNMSECLGVEPTPEPVETEQPAEEPSSGNMGAVILVLIVVAAGAAGALIFLKKKKAAAPKPSGGIDLDDYDFESDDDEDQEEDEGREP